MGITEDLAKSIQKSGWNLTNEGISEFLTEKPNLPVNELIKKALNTDLRNIGAKIIPENVLNGKSEKFEANCVLQIVKLRNLAAPKENENSHTAPPLYKVTLTDGISNCNALVLDNINKLNLNTYPGTKIYLNGSIRIKSGLLILNPKTCEIIGGTVDHLVQKWKQAKDLQQLQYMRGMNLTHSAPPPWVPFGARQTNQVDTSKKVFSQEQNKEEDESSNFSQARQAALAEAMEAKLKITKTFTQQQVDKAQITTDTVDNASRPAASSSSTFYGSSAKSYGSAQNKEQKNKGGKRGKGRKNIDYDDEDDYKEAKDAAKPSTVTLFDLFKTKLDIKEDEVLDTKNILPVGNENSEYNRGSRNNKFSRNSGNPQTFRQRQQQQQQPKNDTNKQKFDLNDFNFELGDTTNVKQLEAQAAIEKQIAKNNVSQKNQLAVQQEVKPIQTQQQRLDNSSSNQGNAYKNQNKQLSNQNRQLSNQYDRNRPNHNEQHQYTQNDTYNYNTNKQMKNSNNFNQNQQKFYNSNDGYNSNYNQQQFYQNQYHQPFYPNDRNNQNYNHSELYQIQHQFPQNDRYNLNQNQIYNNERYNQNQNQQQYFQNDKGQSNRNQRR